MRRGCLDSLLDFAALGDEERARLESQVKDLRTLGALLDWARALDPPVTSPEVVTQDEYTHDVLVPIGADRFLAFDTS
jgi:hypothetical protein